MPWVAFGPGLKKKREKRARGEEKCLSRHQGAPVMGPLKHLNTIERFEGLMGECVKKEKKKVCRHQGTKFLSNWEPSLSPSVRWTGLGGIDIQLLCEKY